MATALHFAANICGRLTAPLKHYLKAIVAGITNDIMTWWTWSIWQRVNDYLEAIKEIIRKMNYRGLAPEGGPSVIVSQG